MTAPASAKLAVAATISSPCEQRIRLRAYELYVRRGNESGSEAKEEIQTAEEQKRQQTGKTARGLATMRKSTMIGACDLPMQTLPDEWYVRICCR
jgi:Protein of unknown function (DUF2934)